MMLSRTCELVTTVGTTPLATNELPMVPRSTNKYSSFAVQAPERTHSEPAPAVQPARVLVAVPLLIAVVVPSGIPAKVTDEVLVVVPFHSTSPNAAPPVT